MPDQDEWDEIERAKARRTQEHLFQFELYDDETGELLTKHHDSFQSFIFLAHGVSKRTGHWMRVESGGRIQPTRIKAETVA